MMVHFLKNLNYGKNYIIDFITNLSYTQCNEGEFPIYMTTSTGEWAKCLGDCGIMIHGCKKSTRKLIFFQGSENFQTESFDGCLPNSGCYMIAAYDSYGDG